MSQSGRPALRNNFCPLPDQPHIDWNAATLAETIICRFFLAARRTTRPQFTIAPDEKEADLAAEMRRDYIPTHKYCPPKLIMQMAGRLHQDHYATDSADSTDSSDERGSEELRTPRRRRNQFIYKRREPFLHSHGFSLKHPHIRRRPKPTAGFLPTF
jgi:hypothetical protein